MKELLFDTDAPEITPDNLAIYLNYYAQPNVMVSCLEGEDVSFLDVLAYVHYASVCVYRKKQTPLVSFFFSIENLLRHARMGRIQKK